MNEIRCSEEELNNTRVGEALTLATVFVVFTTVILSIVAYRLFVSNGGKISLPGGYKFEWTSKWRLLIWIMKISLGRRQCKMGYLPWLIELLALLISTGHKGESSLEIASKLFFQYPNLDKLKNISYQELTSFKGLGKARSLTLLASFELARRIELKKSPEYSYEDVLKRIKGNISLIVPRFF